MNFESIKGVHLQHIATTMQQAQAGAQKIFAQSLESSMLQAQQTQMQSATAPQTGVVRQGFGYIAPLVVKSSNKDEFGNDTDTGFGGMSEMDQLRALVQQGLGMPGMNGMTGSASMDELLQGLASAGKNGALDGALSAYAGAARDSALAPQVQKRVEILASNVTEKAKQNRSVMDSFNVEVNPKYAVNQKGNGETYCNIYLADVTKALGSPVPRIIDRTTGAPATNKDPNITYLNANRMNDWLNGAGKNYGWAEVTPDQAQYYANQGYVAVTSWKNPSGSSGHVQVVSPSKDGLYDESRGVAISQAGSKLLNYAYAEDVYKTSTLKKVQHFVNFAPAQPT